MTLIRNLKTSLRNFMFLCMAILRLHTLCLPLVSQVHPDYFFVFVLHIMCMAILRPLTLYFHPIFHFVFVYGYPMPTHPVFSIGFAGSPRFFTFWFCVWLSYVTHSNFTFGFVHIILFSYTLSPRVCTLVLPQTQIYMKESILRWNPNYLVTVHGWLPMSVWAQ